MAISYILYASVIMKTLSLKKSSLSANIITLRTGSNPLQEMMMMMMEEMMIMEKRETKDLLP